MSRFVKSSSKQGSSSANNSSSNNNMTAEQAGVPNERAEYLKSLQDPDVIERVRCVIKDAHVFKLPPRPTSGGWRGADWKDEVWQGTVKVVERGDVTLVLLVDKQNGNIFAVCPIKDGAVERTVDSSRYFVLRIENANGRHMFIGMAFNERNDAFDFNTSLEDAKREREQEKANAESASASAAAGSGGGGGANVPDGPSKDYSLKEGEKIKINIKTVSAYGDSKSSKDSKRNVGGKQSSVKKSSGGFLLKPSSKDTASRG
eukprot:CAMPEP_0113486096 /NCGR_PEP_ID=MMETSP0014_2-20120614/24821_1 /TAXON_ID=2857 /ORGANISM="Nitzschia sp." /LENGTH=259 /DNA_ID=CAMNT_0000379759 /DNA_START=1265 /DNA_END=2044 /DNA_ORIENTATION=- /assembly_acc=CAM_ASM_000159